MSLYDVMAASQNGACFDHLGRRFQMSEDEAARAVRCLLPSLLRALDGWISRREGMVAMLHALGETSLGTVRSSQTAFNDMRFRDRGVALLRQWREAGSLDSVALAEAADDAGLRPDVTGQLLPWLAVLVMAALQVRAQRPLGWLAADIDGAGSPGNPFRFLAEHLAATKEPAERRQPVRRMLGALLGRQDEPARRAAPP